MGQKNMSDNYNIASEYHVPKNVSALFENSEYYSPENSRYVQNKVDKIIEKLHKSHGASTDIAMQELIENLHFTDIPKEGRDVGSYFNFLDEQVVSHSNYTFSPKYIGHMTSALPYFIRPISSLITAMNQNVVKCETSKSVTPLERQTIAMVHKILYRYPDAFYEQYTHDRKSALGVLTSSGTTANLTALWCARNKCLGATDDFCGIEDAGLHEALRYYKRDGAVIIGSVNMHYSITKAADILGIGTVNVIKVRVDSNNRIDLVQLQEVIKECKAKNQQIIAIIGIAGMTDNGAIDPLEELAAISQKENCHFHIDAAWGGPLIFSDNYSYKIKGIELADTVTIDGHKQFYLPMGIGMLYFKNHRLAANIEKNAAYIIRANSRDIGRYTLEGSRAAFVLYLNAALNIIGKRGYAELIEGGIEKTKYFASLIKESEEFEVLNEPETNILLYSYIPEEFRNPSMEFNSKETEEINRINVTLQRIQRERGMSFVSRSVFGTGKYKDKPVVALRAVIANPLTTKEDLKEILEEQKSIAASLTSSDFK